MDLAVTIMILVGVTAPIVASVVAAVALFVTLKSEAWRRMEERSDRVRFLRKRFAVPMILFAAVEIGLVFAVFALDMVRE